MPIKTWVPDEEITSDGLNSAPNVLNGTAGEPILLTAYSSATNWNLTIRNQGSGGQALTILSSDGLRTLFSVTDAGPSLGASGIVFGPGSAANPSVGVGGSGQGLFSPGTAQIGVSVGGNEVARFGPNGLRLGQPAAPRAWLDVVDTFGGTGWTTDLVTPKYSTLFSLGAFDPATFYQFHVDGGGTNASLHGAIAAGLEIPASAFKTSPHALTDSTFKAAIVGQARVSAPASSNPLGNSQYGWDGVGVYGGASALANTAEVFAGNFLCDDRAGLTHAYLWGLEVDANVYCTPTRTFGVDVNAVFVQPPATDPVNTNVGLDGRSAHAIRVACVGTSASLGKQWTYGLITMDGATKNGIVLGTLSEGLNTTSASQPIYFRGRVQDALGAGSAGCYASNISGGPDGSLQLQPAKIDSAVYVVRSDNLAMAQFTSNGNAGALNGLSINQQATGAAAPAAQASAFWIASSGDVAHGMTALAPTEVWYQQYKYHRTSGGSLMRGLSSDSVAFLLQGCGVNDITAQTLGSSAYVVIQAGKKSGTTVSSPGSTANLLSIGEVAANRFFFRNDGNAYADTAWTTFDAHDDLALLETLERELMPDPIKAAFGEALSGYSREDLEEFGLIGVDSWHQENGETRAMLNTTRLLMLLTGALRQQQAQIQTLTSRLELK